MCDVRLFAVLLFLSQIYGILLLAIELLDMLDITNERPMLFYISLLLQIGYFLKNIINVTVTSQKSYNNKNEHTPLEVSNTSFA